MNTLMTKLQSVLISHEKVLKEQIAIDEKRKTDEANDPCLSTIVESKKRIRMIVLLVAFFMSIFSYILIQHNQSIELEQINRSVTLKVSELNSANISMRDRQVLANSYKDELLDQMYTNRLTTGILFGAVTMSMIITISYIDNKNYYLTTLDQNNCKINK